MKARDRIIALAEQAGGKFKPARHENENGTWWGEEWDCSNLAPEKLVELTVQSCAAQVLLTDLHNAPGGPVAAIHAASRQLKYAFDIDPPAQADEGFDPEAKVQPTPTGSGPWWFVVTSGGGSTFMEVPYTTYAQALAEATRMAEASGNVVYVMQAVSQVQFLPPPPTPPKLVPVVLNFAVPYRGGTP